MRRKLDNGQSQLSLWKAGHKWQRHHYFPALWAQLDHLLVLGNQELRKA